MRERAFIAWAAATLLAACGGDAAPLVCRGTLEVHPATSDGPATFSGTATTTPGGRARVFGHMMNGIPADAAGQVTLSGPLRDSAPHENLEIECALEGDVVRVPATMIVHERFGPAYPGLRSSGQPEILVTLRGARLSVTAPEGTVLAVGAERATVDGSGRAHLDLDPVALVAGLGLETDPQTELPRVRAHPPIRREITATRPQGDPIPGTLDFSDEDLGIALATLLGRVEGGPLALEPEGTGRGLLIVTAHGEGEGPRTYSLRGFDGEIHQPGDVGVVAVVTERERSGSCGTYTNSAGEREGIPWSARDAAVAVYARRTGRRLGERTISARQPPCSRTLHSAPYTEYSIDAVRAFARGFRAD